MAPLSAVLLRARPSQELAIRVLQGVVLCQLLVLGVILSSTIAWALIAIPMTAIVLLFLRERAEARAAESVDEDDYDEPTTLFEPYAEEGSPIIVVRRVPRPQTDARIPAARGNS